MFLAYSVTTPSFRRIRTTARRGNTLYVSSASEFGLLVDQYRAEEKGEVIRVRRPCVMRKSYLFWRNMSRVQTPAKGSLTRRSLALFGDSFGKYRDTTCWRGARFRWGLLSRGGRRHAFSTTVFGTYVFGRIHDRTIVNWSRPLRRWSQGRAANRQQGKRIDQGGRCTFAQAGHHWLQERKEVNQHHKICQEIQQGQERGWARERQKSRLRGVFRQ